MAAKIIAVASTKGGVGKTTIALQLAINRALRGGDVWLVDGDRQKTSMMALALRDQQGAVPGIACASYPDGKLLRSQVRLQRDKWDYIVIDVGGFDSTTLRASLSICDALVVPYQPRSFDIWGLSQMSNLVHEAFEMRDEFPVYALLNSADAAHTADNQDAQDAVSEFPEMTLLPCALGRRKAFATASGFGLSVSELKTKDRKAISEINELLDAVFGKDEPLQKECAVSESEDKASDFKNDTQREAIGDISEEPKQEE